MKLPQIVSVGIFNSQITEKRKITANRKTTMFELELPIENRGISYIDDESRKVSKNTVICAKPGQLRHTKLPFKCYYVHMMVEKGQLFETLMNLPNYLEFSDPSTVLSLFEKMCRYGDTGVAEHAIMLQSVVLELIYRLNQKAAVSRLPHRIKQNNHEVIADTINYIGKNLNMELTLSGLSQRAMFSTTYFHRLFKASTGKTLHHFIEDQRVEKAVNLLLRTDMTLTQIAYECGFSSQSYFSYAFKRNKGMTPKDYAKKMMEQYHE